MTLRDRRYTRRGHRVYKPRRDPDSLSDATACGGGAARRLAHRLRRLARLAAPAPRPRPDERRAGAAALRAGHRPRAQRRPRARRAVPRVEHHPRHGRGAGATAAAGGVRGGLALPRGGVLRRALPPAAPAGVAAAVPRRDHPRGARRQHGRAARPRGGAARQGRPRRGSLRPRLDAPRTLQRPGGRRPALPALPRDRAHGRARGRSPLGAPTAGES